MSYKDLPLTTLATLPGTALNLDSIARLAVAAAAVAIGFLAVAREQGNRVAVGFFGMTIAVALWIGGQALAFAAPDAATALWWNGTVAMLGVSFIPSLLLLFAARVTGARRRLGGPLWVSAGLSAAFYAVFRGTDWLIPFAAPMPWGWVPR